MTPQQFPEQTNVLAKPRSMTDEECSPLPVFSDDRQCVSCWRPTLRERLAILFFGRVWLSVISGTTQPPVWLAGCRSIFSKPAARRIWSRSTRNSFGTQWGDS